MPMTAPSDPAATARLWHDAAVRQGSLTVPIRPELVGRLLAELAIARIARDDARTERDRLASTTAGRDTATARKENPDE
jgi:hypothetical protein